ncbi:hypothetical protein [Heliothis virescens ascovirus 3j]|uniref:Uncharacterized protein n=2 Tax=unclassified Ascovirus TaxID=328613 RepID=A0A2Z5UZQ0_9VIRU|nr:hypothetical protein [Heliothis virescens ascovirus 3j]
MNCETFSVYIIIATLANASLAFENYDATNMSFPKLLPVLVVILFISASMVTARANLDAFCAHHITGGDWLFSDLQLCRVLCTLQRIRPPLYDRFCDQIMM